MCRAIINPELSDIWESYKEYVTLNSIEQDSIPLDKSAEFGFYKGYVIAVEKETGRKIKLHLCPHDLWKQK